MFLFIYLFIYLYVCLYLYTYEGRVPPGLPPAAPFPDSGFRHWTIGARSLSKELVSRIPIEMPEIFNPPDRQRAMLSDQQQAFSPILRVACPPLLRNNIWFSSWSMPFRVQLREFACRSVRPIHISRIWKWGLTPADSLCGVDLLQT